MTYALSFMVDVLTLALCSVALLRYGRLSHSHPATIYLIFHVFTFTWRLSGLMGGAHTLFSEYGPAFQPVTEDEIVRAAIVADVALIALTLACVLVARRERAVSTEEVYGVVPVLDKRIIWAVLAAAVPLGVFGMLSYSVVPETVLNPALGGEGVTGSWASSSYLAILPAWPGLSLLVLIYYYGFRRWLVAPMVVYLAVMAIQGYHRFRVVIPIILMLQIYLDRHGQRWPRFAGVAVLLALGTAFFPLKIIGRMVQERSSVAEIVQVSSEVITEASDGNAADQQFLDQFAGCLTLVDDRGSYFYGKPFLAVVTLPIPRQWWPEKPGLADHLADMSTPSRPMSQMGMILTYLGDAYANFGYVGVVVLPFALGYSLSLAYASAYRRPYLSLFRFCYLMMACNLIQVFRDGVVSIVIFTVVHMMPLAAIVLLHKWFPNFKDRDHIRADSDKADYASADPG